MAPHTSVELSPVATEVAPAVEAEREMAPHTSVEPSPNHPAPWFTQV